MHLVLAVLCLAVAAPVWGDTVSYNTNSPVPSSTTDWTSILAFPQFDPSLGTLTQVDLSLSSSFNTVLSVVNSSPNSSSGNARTELQITVQDVGNLLYAPEIDAFSPELNYSLSAGGSTSSTLLAETATAVEDYTNSTILGQFTGGGTISLPASTFTQTVVSNTGGNTAASQMTTASLTGTVTYEYTPNAVPEPSTLALLAVGAIGLAGYRWRRRAV